eukprot:55733_1
MIAQIIHHGIEKDAFRHQDWCSMCEHVMYAFGGYRERWFDTDMWAFCILDSVEPTPSPSPAPTGASSNPTPSPSKSPTQPSKSPSEMPTYQSNDTMRQNDGSDNTVLIVLAVIGILFGVGACFMMGIMYGRKHNGNAVVTQVELGEENQNEQDQTTQGLVGDGIETQAVVYK